MESIVLLDRGGTALVVVNYFIRLHCVANLVAIHSVDIAGVVRHEGLH